MRATIYGPAALLLAGLCSCPAQAQQVIWMAPGLHRPLGVAPDACGPGFYWANCHGVVYGPAHYLVPPFAPESGITPQQALAMMQYGQQGQQGQHGGQGGHSGPPQFNPFPNANPYGSPYHLFAQGQGGPRLPYPGAIPHPGALPHPGHPGMPPTPPMPPYPGAMPNHNGGPQQPTFVSHPFARSPRDFFMWNEVMDEANKRYQLPALVP